METFETFIHGKVIAKECKQHPKTSVLLWCDYLTTKEGEIDYYQPVNIYRTKSKYYIKRTLSQFHDTNN
jgi:hypothetical protein